MNVVTAGLLGLLLLAVPVFGFLLDPASEDGADAGSPYDAVRALMAGMPCEAPSVDGFSTSANMLHLADIAVPEGDLGEMDVRGNIALLAAKAMGGFHVVDIADPLAPKFLANFYIPGTDSRDVKWLPNGTGAVIASNRLLITVDLTDPAQPVEKARAAVPTQAHMVTPAEFDGKTYLYVASQTTNWPAYVYELKPDWNMTEVGRFGLPAKPVESLALGNHDITIYHDELLGERILYLADGFAGWSAWSLQDPAKPARVASWLAPEPGVGFVHSIRVGFYDDKRIVVTMAEAGVNTLKIYDATDLEQPRLIGRWNADLTRPIIPQHVPQLLGDWLVMAHYTEGLFVFNIADVIDAPPAVGWTEMEPAAHYELSKRATPDALGFANVWDVVVIDGILYATDMTGKMYVVGFACFPAGDAAFTAKE